MSKQPFFGPDNPHPLSQLQTELVWEGKYDEYGNRNLPTIQAEPTYIYSIRKSNRLV